MTRKELREAAYRKLAERNPDTSFWPPDDINLYLNLSYEQVVAEAELLQCESIASAKASRGVYARPKDTLRIISVRYAGREAPLQRTTLSILDDSDPGWNERVCLSGETPQFWAARSQLFHLIPAPAADLEDAIKMWCVQAPAWMVADTDEPEITTAYQEAIIDGAVRRALEADRTNPDNLRAGRDIQANVTRAILNARQLDARVAPRPVMKDIRDFDTDSGWRD